MKRFVLIFFALFCIAQFSNAQAFTSLQLVVAEPTESFRERAGTGFGAQGTYMYFFHPRFALFGSAGYVKWNAPADSPPNNEHKFVSIPVQAGLRFLFSKDIVAPYAGLSVGMHYLRIRGLTPDVIPVVYEDRTELKFGFSPHLGLGIRLIRPIGVMVDGAYNVIYTPGSPSKFFSLSAGLAVGF